MKYSNSNKWSYRRAVAPYTGAWIEILNLLRKASRPSVAPYTGAWIEIDAIVYAFNGAGSLPTRERGLK